MSLIVAGLNSGTSVDSIDVSICQINKTLQPKLLFHYSKEWSESDRTRILSAQKGTNLTMIEVSDLHRMIGERFCETLESAIKAWKDPKQTVDLVGMHGQTMAHHVDSEGRTVSTMQLGDPNYIACRMKIPVVSSFRLSDVALGGSGAPLTAIQDYYERKGANQGYERKGANQQNQQDDEKKDPNQQNDEKKDPNQQNDEKKDPNQQNDEKKDPNQQNDEKKDPNQQNQQRSTAVKIFQNIGGIANCSIIYDDSFIGFDQGPGNTLCDSAMRMLSGGKKQMDEDGKMAAQGKIDWNLLETMKSHPYFSLKAPKTTGPELFSSEYVEKLWMPYPKDFQNQCDFLSTLCELTCQIICESYFEIIPKKYHSERIEVSINGGGWHNVELRNRISKMLLQKFPKVNIVRSNHVDSRESTLFALLAFMHEKRIACPILSQITGSSQNGILGSLTRAQDLFS